jgi:HEAT repeat protein
MLEPAAPCEKTVEVAMQREIRIRSSWSNHSGGFQRPVLFVTASTTQSPGFWAGVYPLREIAIKMRYTAWKLLIALVVLLPASAGSTLHARQPSEISVGGKPRAFWIASLNSEDKKIRRQSGEALGLMGPSANEAVPKLIIAAGDVDEQVRSSAVTALGEIGRGAEAAVPMLVRRLLETQSGTEIDSAQFALVGIGRTAVPELVNRLLHDDKANKFRLVETLGRFGSDAESAVPAILAELEAAGPRPSYIRSLIETLGRIGPGATPAAPALARIVAERFSDGPQPNEMLGPLIVALSRIGEPPVAILIERLSNRDPELRQLAAELLGKIGPRAKASTEKLAAIIDNRREPGCRTAAAIALSRIDPDSARVVPALIGAIDEDPARAIRALIDLGPRAAAAVPRLVALLGVDEKKVADPPSRLALLALAQIDPEGLQCLPAVIHAFESHIDETRACAAYALAEFGPSARASVPSLVRGFLAESETYSDDSIDAIHDGIAVALRQIGANPNFVVPTMISVLKNQQKSDHHRNALIALAGYGPAAKAALPQLIAALDGRWRALAAEVLGRIGPDAAEALPALRAIIAKKDVAARRSEVLIAILRIDPASAKEVETALASIENFEDRARIAGALGRTSPEGEGLTRRYLKAIDGWLERENVDAVTRAIERFVTILGSFGPAAHAAIPRLSSLLTHKDRAIRLAARDALARIEMTRSP